MLQSSDPRTPRTSESRYACPAKEKQKRYNQVMEFYYNFLTGGISEVL
jgi:hypothetical protein